MRFIAALFAVALPAISSTMAEIVLPEGYWMKQVLPVRHPPRVARNLPGPLLNATLDCKKRYNLPSEYFYDIRGSRWDGITEKQIKAACNAGEALMTDWQFESWTRPDCHLDWVANEVKEVCHPNNITEWYASFSMTMIIGHEFAMTDAFDHLTGAYGDLNHMTERARWVMTNGTHDLESDMNESFPPAGWQFRCFWA